jgi:phenylacetate-CoA ligase
MKAKVFWSKNRIFRNHALKLYHESLANENKSRDEIIEINWDKRKKIIDYCFENIPFYKKHFKNSFFHPNDLKSLEDWDKVPVLEKKHLRIDKEEILYPGISAKELIKVTTGGSTGKPLNTFRDKRFPEEIIKWRMLKRWEAKPSDDKLMLWRMTESSMSLKNRIINEMIWWPTKRFKVDVSSLNQEKLNDITEYLFKEKPPIVWGYVGAVEQLAIHMEALKLEHDYNPLVWVTAAPLTEVQKNLINKTLSNKVLNQYACSEVHWIAANVPGSDYLVVEDDFRHVDIVDKSGNILKENVEGDILVSDLENYAFPLIKYRLGDRSMRLSAELDSLPFSKIAPVKGRTTDYIKTPSGIIVSGEYLTTIFDDFSSAIKQFQVVQHKNYEIEINYVPFENANHNISEILKKVSDKLQKMTNNEIKIHFITRKFIKSDAGKIRFIISDI